MTSPLAALAQALDVRLSLKVHSLEQRQEGWILKSEDGSDLAQAVDAVIFAIPAPQVVQVLGPVTPLWLEVASGLKMHPCWAVMATATENEATPFDAAFINEGPLAWIANNASKPGRSQTALWTLHASAAWSLDYLNEDPQAVTKILIDEFVRITQLSVSEAVAHRWLYAKADAGAHQGYLWDADLQLAACGDWLWGGNVEGAWQSGQACAQAIG